MRLQEMAHARTGDKGNMINISLIAYSANDFPMLEERVTAERVAAHFKSLISGPVVRFSLPHLSALNFVLKRPDNLGVTRSLALDAHGKCLGSALLEMEI
jgi:hypothetical protein